MVDVPLSQSKGRDEKSSLGCTVLVIKTPYKYEKRKDRLAVPEKMPSVEEFSYFIVVTTVYHSLVHKNKFTALNLYIADIYTSKRAKRA